MMFKVLTFQGHHLWVDEIQLITIQLYSPREGATFPQGTQKLSTPKHKLKGKG